MASDQSKKVSSFATEMAAATKDFHKTLEIKSVKTTVGNPNELLTAIQAVARFLIPQIEKFYSASLQEAYTSLIPELEPSVRQIGNLLEIFRLTASGIPSYTKILAEISQSERLARRCEVSISTFSQFPIEELSFRDWEAVRLKALDLKIILNRHLESSTDV